MSRRLGIALVALASLGALCRPQFTPPVSDSCATPTMAAVDSLTIGTGDDSTFVPLHDDDVVHLQVGGQGGRMLPLRLQIAGAATPACIALRAVVTSPSASTPAGMSELAVDSTALKTYAQPDGTFLTRPEYLVMSGYGPAANPLLVQVDALGRTATVRVWVDTRLTDAGSPD